MHFLKQTILTLSLIALVGMSGIGMLAITGHHHEPGCPFMPGEYAICQMDVFDHIAAWHSAFTGILPTILLIALAITLVFAYWLTSCDRPPDLRYAISRRETHAHDTPPPYQELFSNGILHPKSP